ncbi:2'-5' RNA ligase family protein [Patescibacteria group bacterium]
MENKYSIWLIPTGEVYKRFKEKISQLSRQYNSPNFDPHITLIGELVGSEEEVATKTTKLTNIIQPFKIKFLKADYFDEHFKALFIRAEKTTDLIEANKKASKVFGLPNNLDYMPHLSFIYGDFDSKTKEEIIKNLGREFNVDFEVKSIHLFFTTGEVKDWYKVGEYHLSNNRL